MWFTLERVVHPAHPGRRWRWMRMDASLTASLDTPRYSRSRAGAVKNIRRYAKQHDHRPSAIHVKMPV